VNYLEGRDYWVRYAQFPNTASEAAVVSHGDGTFTIYLNTLYSDDVLAVRLQHELRHLEKEHFYRDDLTIRQVERQADGEPEQPAGEWSPPSGETGEKKPRLPDVFFDEPPEGTIPIFHSLDHMTHYVHAYLEQWRADRRKKQS